MFSGLVEIKKSLRGLHLKYFWQCLMSSWQANVDHADSADSRCPCTVTSLPYAGLNAIVDKASLVCDASGSLRLLVVGLGGGAVRRAPQDDLRRALQLQSYFRQRDRLLFAHLLRLGRSEDDR